MEKNTGEEFFTTKVHEGLDSQALFFLCAPSAPLWLIS
jgi:hypothetical protein